MNYKNIFKAKFIDRPNRFIANCEVDGKVEVVHVKNTGRCKELLTSGATVYLEKSDNESRKTKYDLISVIKGSSLINMDSFAPNLATFEWLKKGELVKSPTYIKPEKVFGKSRIDFYVENESEKVYIEVKGVTLENNGIAMFPDAPTVRGTKHINELISAKKQGFRAIILFVIQMEEVTKFIPNEKTDKDFASTLKKAEKCGVEIVAMNCKVTKNSMTIYKQIKVEL